MTDRGQPRLEVRRYQPSTDTQPRDPLVRLQGSVISCNRATDPVLANDEGGLAMDVGAWLSCVEAIDRLRFVPIHPSLALASTMLPGEFHKDPADRLIVATARQVGATLITADEKILRYPHVRTLW